MNRLLAAALPPLLAGTLFAPVPVAAQDAGDAEKYNTVIIYGEDECPVSDGDVITVCARMDESERYRIPPNLRESESPSNKAWSERVRSFETVGKSGPLSCTPIGAGGELGCTAEFINAAYAEKAESSDIRFSQLIAEERAARLSTLDADAADTQARVEELERAYMERIRREEAGEVAPRTAAQPGTAEVVDPSRLTPADAPPPLPSESDD